ncbi:hypothetical protein mRhiFer1_009146 [Rhinolophus ferrumequinum]|uniref:Uncharacterized protein n=1 Tax=Rhinolophus ferrumequinum TaxID=59479 RepID=A0A7J7SJA9_RHIFE|nr:hypothetical protein mRhiFer1_009146 [Rhinolophus ferrumequinum]
MLLILESGPHSVDCFGFEPYSLWLRFWTPTFQLYSGLPTPLNLPPSCLKSSHSRSLPSRFLCSSLSILSLISLKFLCPRTLSSPHLSPPDMHLPLLYPRYLGDLGLPHSSGGFTIQETSPAA